MLSLSRKHKHSSSNRKQPRALQHYVLSAIAIKNIKNHNFEIVLAKVLSWWKNFSKFKLENSPEIE